MYERYREALASVPLPAALVDLDAVDANVDALIQPVRASNKTLRVASKSIRCVELLRHITARGGGAIHGIMAYAASEAVHLVDHGFHDVLVAYPVARELEATLIAEANRRAKVSVVVDAQTHLDVLDEAAQKAEVQIPVVVEADVAFRPFGGSVHLGAHRSPLRSPQAVVDLARRAAAKRHLVVHGVMAYESQIAGLQDANPFEPLLNAPKRWLKRLSRPDVARTRADIARGLSDADIPIEMFNGGGTGSLRSSCEEQVLTEVAAGSGFLGSLLFDYFEGLSIRPAAMFALTITRVPEAGLVTCHGGGYVASGSASPDKLPRPFLPEGLSLLDMEGAGEVQTPVKVPAGVRLGIGDPVFFRHAKAGELAKNFREYHLVRGQQVVDTVPTYRGEGCCFL